MKIFDAAGATIALAYGRAQALFQEGLETIARRHPACIADQCSAFSRSFFASRVKETVR